MAKRNKRKNNSRYSLLLLLLLLVFLIVSTYAWFTANQTVTISTLDVNVQTSNGLQISADAINWKTILQKEDITGATATYATNTNQMPTEMEPVSTAGVVASGVMDMYSGEVDAHDNGVDYTLVSNKLTDTRGTDGKYIAFYSGKIIELSNIEIGDDGLKMSPSGEYLSLYRNIDGVTTYKVIRLSNGEYVDFNTDTGISGHYLDWIDSNTLVYYGVNNEGVNGIFTYNLESSEEKLLYNIDGGIVQYLSTDSEGIVILQETINDEKILQVINSKTSEVKTISKDITRLYDIVNVDGNYYVLGEFNDGILSIYKLQDGKHYRLIFDFPSSIKATRYGLAVDEDGNILFIGSNSDPELEEIYSISKDGTIRKVSESKNEYSFVK